MPSRILCLLLGLALAASGAGAQLRPKDSIPVSGRTDATDSYTLTRWIGLRSKKSDDCPSVAGWTNESLLRRALKSAYLEQVPAEDADLIRRLGLDRFCIYTSDTAKDFPVPRGMVAQRDRVALASQAGPLEQSVWPSLERHFLEHAGQFPLKLRGRPGVRLAFLDSQPEQADDDRPPAQPPAGSQHGYTLAHLARQLVCPPEGPCAASIASRRALGHDRFRADAPFVPLPGSMAGNIGSISELAETLLAEVLRWRHTKSHQHLILNLSLGWDGELALLEGRSPDLATRRVEDLEPSVHAVYQALQFAREREVLVIAAAGNRRGGRPESRWPLLPAAWELRRPSSPPRAEAGGALVYAVGGVDWQGLPLPNARLGGQPRRVAYGDHAVTAAGPGPTAIYTGSSVSAAIVSSAAAVIWHLRPELRPNQVMELIDRSGEDLEARASFYPRKRPTSREPAPRLRRVTVCRAARLACGTGAPCPALLSAPTCPERRPPNLALQLALLKAIAPPVYKRASPPPAFVPPCEPITQLWTRDGNVIANPCPTEQFSSVSNERWVFPQPDDPPCPGCSIYTKPPLEAALAPRIPAAEAQEHALAIDIDPLWCRDVRLLSATLDIDCFERGELVSRMTYPIDVCPAQGKPWAVPVPGLDQRGSFLGCRAQLNFVVEKGGETRSIQNPVFVSENRGTPRKPS